jgi:hypothetical protein
MAMAVAILSESVPAYSQNNNSKMRVSLTLKDGDSVVNNPVVKAEIEKAWSESNPGTKKSMEQGGWIIKDPQTGEYSVDRWKAIGNDRINPGPVPKNAVGCFHTHPNYGPAGEGFVWGIGPSDSDFRISAWKGVPSYVRNIEGLMRIDTGTSFFSRARSFIFGTGEAYYVW